MKKSSLIPVLLFMMWSCTPKDSGPVIIHESTRDNHMNATGMVVSIEENLPDMHSFTLIIPVGDTILFHDKKGEFQFAAYDIYADTTIGQFGRFGNGPGEIANFGSTFYDRKSKILYGNDGNRNTISGFYLPEALSDSDYNAFDKFKIGFLESLFVSPNYINDSTIICAAHIPDSNSPAEFQLAKFSLITKSITPFDSVPYYDRARFAVTVSPEKNLIFTADMYQDVISTYTIDGKLTSRIFGPDYTTNIKKRDSYFSGPRICGDKVAILCNSPDSKAPDRRIINQIIFTNFNGRYIRTLDFDFPIIQIAYHAKTNRLYMTTDGEPQFCYLPLDKL